ncbi:GTP cyclohydrolase IIa [Salinarchaeum laminariae]|uniref:GTP cyclohydrolase IIa n=1 Tax=Salinarchaeum laminariae TaxID=869888 RepID=UPI0020BEBFD6|nr:GTP cyclohydrolase IIa [Salinarchaeum laminariae]
MTATQVTLFQLDNYGPWTVTPEPRPEPELQALQARLYADLADAVGDRGGYVFVTRFDNVVAVTNGLDREDHRAIQAAIAERYPVTVSAAIGYDERPATALAEATERLQNQGSAQDAARTEVLVGEPLQAETGSGSASGTAPGTVRVAHFDVVDVTGQLTDQVDAYGAHLEVQGATQTLSRYCYDQHGALAFFVGGDNVIAICPDLDVAAYEAVIEHVRETVGVQFQVGIGDGSTATEAGMAAKFALEDCRRDGSRVEGLAAPTAD